LHACRSTLEDPQVQKKQTTPAKGNSAKESLAYFLSGKSVEEIAQLRGYATSTIEEHLSRFVLSNELEITHLLNTDEISKIRQAIKECKNQTITEIKQHLNNQFGYALIKLVNQLYKEDK
jgi:hypothetical protein